MFAVFPITLFIVGTVILVGLPLGFSAKSYFRSRGRRKAICPETRNPVEVTLDAKYAFQTALKGEEHSRLASCSRWPEKANCDQECIAQVYPTPENLERVLQKWYEGKACGICGRLLSPADWRRGRLALLNEKQKMFELRHMHLDELPTILDRMRPLCWTCHQEERARHPQQRRTLKGERLTATGEVAD